MRGGKEAVSATNTQVESGGKEESVMGSGGAASGDGEKGYDWLEEDRKGKKERSTEKIDSGREK